MCIVLAGMFNRSALYELADLSLEPAVLEPRATQ